jgi:hypothetical protein
VDRQCWVLWAAHLAIFVALAKAVRARCIAELCRLRKELRGVFIVDKYDVVYTALVQERKLVQRVWNSAVACSAERLSHLTPSFGRLDMPNSPFSSARPRRYSAPGCDDAATLR